MAGNITASVDAVGGADGYAWHVTPVGKTGPANATIIFGTAEPSITIPADATSRKAGDKVYVYAQAFKITPEGDDAVAKGQFLMAHEDGTQSEWSAGVGVTIA